MPTVKADIVIRLDIEVEAESCAVAEELINQRRKSIVFIGIENDDKRILCLKISQINVLNMESDEIEEQERLDLEVVLDKEASKHRLDSTKKTE
jgi:hypothetical protein